VTSHRVNWERVFDAIEHPKAIAVYESPESSGHWIVRYFHADEPLTFPSSVDAAKVLWFNDAGEAHRARNEKSRAFDEVEVKRIVAAADLASDQNHVMECPYCDKCIQLCDGWLAHFEPQCEEFTRRAPQEILDAWAAKGAGRLSYYR
jgi:hypothetical protein